MKNNRAYSFRMSLFTISAVLCVIAGVSWITRSVEARPDMHESRVVSEVLKPGSGLPQIGGSFTLTDQNGVKRSDIDFRGKYMLVYFGYTFCPDICPTALSGITEALDMIGTKANKIQTIFITIDPERDTVEHLSEYMKNFHDSIVALTGSKEDISKIAKAYKVYAKKVKPEGTSASYLMDHTSIIYVMDYKGKFVAHFNHETPSENIAAGLNKFLG